MTKPAKLIAKLLSYLLSPILMKSPKEIYDAIVNQDKQKIYNWFVANKVNKAITTFFLIIIGIMLTHIVYMATLYIIVKKFGTEKFVKEILKPFKVADPHELDCLVHYMTDTRILGKTYAYVSLLFMSPVLEVANILGCEVLVTRIVKSYKSLAYASIVVSLITQKTWTKDEVVRYIVNILSQIGVENPKQALDTIIDVLQDLEKRLPNLVKAYSKLGKDWNQLSKPKGNPIQKMISYPANSLKVGYRFLHAVILTSHNTLVIANELNAAENALKMLTKWSYKIESKDILKIIGVILANYLSKKLLRSTSEYLLTKRYGLMLFIISALIFIVLEVLIDCNTHKYILKTIRKN